MTFPVFLSLAGRPVVVVGGGPVGRRRAAAVRAAGAVVRVVDPAEPPAGFTGPGLEWLAESYRPAHLDGAALVFAAVSPDVDPSILSDAAARGIWACSAAAPDLGSFTLPAVVRAGDLTIAVGTGGASPALTRRLKRKLQAEFDGAYAAWVALLAELRPAVRAAVPDPARRKAVYQALAEGAWLDRIRAEGADAVRAAMLAAVRGMANVE